ncbi:hypothetical protein [Tateyamaria sp. SN6-1]|uniref:hypothetical protein n=1 Tax=Tateyamaria sp. SN6-1 TaxID=3092148 RepID=UPI0039F5B34B
MAGFGATSALAQAETVLAVGTITSTSVIAGILVATVIIAVADDGTVTTTTVALGPAT